jgi:hypothetical protein
MTIVVFVGPTLSPDECRRELDAVYLPPVAQGDVHRAAQEHPRAIAIIDGLFEQVPAVWHKEILWAMAQGIHVFGASSMGALRAAELAAFGMVGVGRIFEAFRDGVLTDDDEVTLVHAGEQQGYKRYADAMVDIRFTLARAERDGILTRASRDRLLALAKRTHYSERSYAALVERGGEAGVAPEELGRLREWLPGGRVEQKKLDALELLRFLEGWRRTDPGPKQVDFRFEHTDAWEQVARRSLGERPGAGADRLPEGLLLDELRLNPEAFQHALAAVMARGLALGEVKRRNLQVDEPRFRETVNAFRLENELIEPETLQAWMARQDLDPGGFGALMEREAAVGIARNLVAADGAANLLDHLRISGQYGDLVARALAKRARLGPRFENPGSMDIPLAEADLMEWFFVGTLGRTVPMNLEVQARRMGFEDRDAMVQAIIREYLYQTQS